MNGERMKIAVLVSGGVDSSVALHLLKAEGHDLTAYYLKIWLEDELSYLGNCPWQEDLQYVQAVCQQVGVPLEIVSLQKEYHDEVVLHTIREVEAGRTPNPDVLCNSRIKFGVFLKHIGTGYDAIASGHYAQKKRIGNQYVLVQAPDPVKDQSYFLSHLTQQQLARLIFPIGHLYKWQVREYAHMHNLPNKDRKDSQGICFLGKLKFKEFVGHYLGTKKGELREYETGTVLGMHDGYWFYTIGQRQGIGLGGGPWYVVAKDTVANCVYVSKNYYSDEKKRDLVVIESCNWIAGKPKKQDVLIKMRHGPVMIPAMHVPQDESKSILYLGERDQGIAPGQFAAVYVDTICLGSGIIAHDTLPISEFET